MQKHTYTEHLALHLIVWMEPYYYLWLSPDRKCRSICNNNRPKVSGEHHKKSLDVVFLCCVLMFCKLKQMLQKNKIWTLVLVPVAYWYNNTKEPWRSPSLPKHVGNCFINFYILINTALPFHGLTFFSALVTYLHNSPSEGTHPRTPQ